MISLHLMSIYAAVGAAAWCLMLFATYVLLELSEDDADE